MKEKQDYLRDIAEIRSMMERSSKFLSLSGWAGVLAGLYALTGVYLAWSVLEFNPDRIVYEASEIRTALPGLPQAFLLAVMVLMLAIGTAVLLSSRKAKAKGEKAWNASSRRLLTYMAVPLLTGGLLVLILYTQGLIGLIAPMMLLFYGLALFNAGKFSYPALRFLGIIQLGLGLIASYFVEYGLLCWALGFGFLHIIYGTYIYYKYER